jgi:hypothetical protein
MVRAKIAEKDRHGARLSRGRDGGIIPYFQPDLSIHPTATYSHRSAQSLIMVVTLLRQRLWRKDRPKDQAKTIACH